MWLWQAIFLGIRRQNLYTNGEYVFTLAQDLSYSVLEAKPSALDNLRDCLMVILLSYSELQSHLSYLFSNFKLLNQYLSQILTQVTSQTGNLKKLLH